MEQLDTQTILIALGGVAILIVLSVIRGLIRRKPKRSNSAKKRTSQKRASGRRPPPKRDHSAGPLGEGLLELAQKAGVKPARNADREVGRVAKVSPGAAIPLAWGPVEHGIERAVERVGAKSEDVESTVGQLRFLESKDRLSDDTARLLHKMRQLRNRAAHNELEPDEVDSTAARAYGRIAKAMVGTLDKMR